MQDCMLSVRHFRMDNNFQTSFIPKKPLADTSTVARSSSTSFLSLIAWLLVIAAGVFAGGSYLYKKNLESSLTRMRSDLAAARNSFEPSLITELQKLNKRIDSANELLANHVVITPVFSTLSKSTLKSVQFTRFGYTLPSDSGSSVTVRMAGKARDYTSIALESDQLAANKNIHNAIFSNLSLDERTGFVNFDLTFTVDQDLIRYTNHLADVIGASPAATQ